MIVLLVVLLVLSLAAFAAALAWAFCLAERIQVETMADALRSLPVTDQTTSMPRIHVGKPEPWMITPPTWPQPPRAARDVTEADIDAAQRDIEGALGHKLDPRDVPGFRAAVRESYERMAR